MCGIVGVFHQQGQRAVDPDDLARMCRLLTHRGPDGEGFHLSPDRRLGLGHRRLSIIDLEGGLQPMTVGPLTIVFNGEIYNFRELRAELEQRGALFSTRSDTEVILRLYQEYGVDALLKLNGIFAFAIWDQQQQQLFCARDQLGVKPFYYRAIGGSLVFASEIKAILEHPGVPREVDTAAIAQCLTLRFVPSPKTVFRDILKLAPGSWMRLDARGIEHGVYWQPKPVLSNIAFEDAVEVYRDKLARAVERQMISDVPIGLMLSGGIDSAVIAALMRRSAPAGRLKSFTVGFEDGERTNEMEEARATAELFDLDHHEMMISSKDYQAFFSDFIWHQEEPLGNESAPAGYFVARLARPEVKVLLAGQGADEPLAGYDRYKGERYSSLLRRLPARLLATARTHGTRLSGSNEKLRRSIDALGEEDTTRRFLRIYSIFGPEVQRSLWRDHSATEGLVSELSAIIDAQRGPVASFDSVAQMLYVDTRLWLPDDLLTASDKMTMAASIELRVPFLDVELIEWLETLPSHFKLRLLTGKYIHKVAAKAWLPPEIIQRKKKGFANPVDRWLRKELSASFEGLVFGPDSLARRFFDLEVIRGLIAEDRSGAQDYKRQLFLLLVLELWYQRFIRGEASQR